MDGLTYGQELAIVIAANIIAWGLLAYSKYTDRKYKQQ